MACNIRQNLIQTAVDRNLITAKLTVLNKTELEKYNDNNDSVARNKYGVTAEGKPFIITSLDTVELNDPYLSELQTIVTNNNLDVTYDEAISEARNKILDDIRRFAPLSNFIKSYENDKIVLNDYAGRNGHLVNSAVNKFKKKYPAVKLYLDLFEKELKFAVPQTVFNQFFNSAPTIKKDIEPVFDKELAQKIQDKLKTLYPEIKLNIINNPVWEQGDNVFNQEEYNNQVNYRLKATEKVLDNLAKIEQWELNKSIDQNTLWRKIGELGIPKQQLELLKESEGNTIEEKLSSFVANYSYTIEINTAKSKKETGGEFDEDGRWIKYEETLPTEQPTQHYSNLTVPGGTNYTENEIATPLITPSIKGHAQFATDNGIGWFRSDEASFIKKAMSVQNKEKNFEYAGNEYTREYSLSKGFEHKKNGQIISEEEYRKAKYADPKTRRILEVQSDLFQKGRDKKDLVGTNKVTKATGRNGDFNDKVEFIEGDKNQNQFLQLLNKDNNWVTFFVKSIIQDSAKKGYEKVLFPTGKTVEKIEGFNRITKEIEKFDKEIEWINSQTDEGVIIDKYPYTNKKDKTDKTGIEAVKDLRIQKINKDKQHYLDAKKDTLSTINFYENTVTNILKKQGYNPVLITDEYGNTWIEITINQARDLSEVLLQRNEANQIIGQANIKAMTVLVDAINQKQDTLPHEYAHHYIAWFRNTPIVQEAIKKWGSEEALVQSIGEQVIKQKGEAYNWWNKFVEWIMNQFNSLSKLQKEQLTEILTDAFLTRRDLVSNQDINEIKNGVPELFESNPELANAVYEALGFQTNITQDNKSYYRGQIEEPVIDKDGNLILYGREDELYKKAGLKTKGVSMTDDLQSAVEYGNGQLEVAKNLASETYDAEQELQKLFDSGYYLIQIPKDISNEIVKEAGEVKVIGDKIIIPKGQYRIEQVIDGVETAITPQQKQQATFMFSEFLDVYLQDFEQVEKILKEEKIIDKKCS